MSRPTTLAALLAVLSVACTRDAGPGTVCGDGVVTGDEACDDGNLSFLDDCLPGCVRATCGDGFVRGEAADPADREACDPAAGDQCTCDDDCTPAVCGDGHLNRAAGEVCDDGNTVDADGCRADCRSDETCGNRIVDDHLPRRRADDPGCRTATAQGTGCAEVCDDGNRVSGDGCSENCLSEESCANGIVDALGDGASNPPEACDDGNLVDTDACGRDCRAQPDGGCGNGRWNGPPEECDSGLAQTAACDQSADRADPQNCTLARCGDGHLNPAAGEQCDDGNPRLDDDCPACRPAFCGDGVTDRQPPILEGCDAGAANGQPGVPCSVACTVVRG